ncbi:MAG: type VI secretion lipoprotein TssJ, partial [Planctomycetota bacterium]|nr:type VI secretion lipoprotein TssJ [Planctomycetota bacterium]
MLLIRRGLALLSLPLLTLFFSACGPPGSGNGFFPPGRSLSDSESRPVSGSAPLPALDPRLDPRSRPGIRDLRQARADAWMEDRINANGGMLHFAADGSASRPDQVSYVAERGALTLDIAAAPDLNLSGGLPHALDIVVYQLSDLLAFNRLAGTEDGFARLVAGGYFDPAVRAARKFSFQPGERGVVSLERPEHGRYVALVAAYNRPAGYDAGRVKLTEYPVGVYGERRKTPPREGGAGLLGNILPLSRAIALFRPLPLNL